MSGWSIVGGDTMCWSARPYQSLQGWPSPYNLAKLWAAKCNTVTVHADNDQIIMSIECIYLILKVHKFAL